MTPEKCYTITIKGTVQGVGFRPFVFRLAERLGITGDVKNDSRGVVIRAYGTEDRLREFAKSLSHSPPPLAAIRSIDIVVSVPDASPAGFAIAETGRGESREIDITPDIAVCPACTREMLDPKNRRFRHPFINCTDCGPRYTIIKELPYDRRATTMASFEMCDNCRKEYEDPSDRRFHAQPVCCNDCGPTLSLIDNTGASLSKDNSIAAAIDLLRQGKILAIKGIGGFHLACRPDKSDAVSLLRRRKMREEKPFALMVKDLAAARWLAVVGEAERQMLESPQRPIVICKRLPERPGIAQEVAPGLTTLGIMLPYTALHHLLFNDAPFEALVMTSANMSDEPIIYENDDALRALSAIADAFLLHDRDIFMRNDDSIVRIVNNDPIVLRRSRGFVPEPLPSPHAVDGLVALGGVLKSTAAVGRGRDCYLSQYIGPIETVEQLDTLTLAVSHLTKALGVTAHTYVCDLHPQSLIASSAETSGFAIVKVQHHHAHAAACMAENEIAGGAVCIVYDGTGYGDDGTIWGGEIFHAYYSGYKRLGNLMPLLLPGGDEAIRNPGRIALAALYKLIGDNAAGAMPWMDTAETSAVIDMVKSGAGCVPSCGMGRLFDAVSALLGVCKKRTYEGQPAIMLEGIADGGETGSYESPLSICENRISIDGAAVLLDVYEDMKHKTPVKKIAARFHTTIVQATATAALHASKQCGLKTVCLSGGVFQNALLVQRLVPLLKQAGLTPVPHRRTPPNDECISYGQLVVAGAMIAKRSGG
jgi:hydrogenase maturation protein HypF